MLDNFGALDSSAAVERIWTGMRQARAHSRRTAPAGTGAIRRPKRRRSKRWRRACEPRGCCRRSASRSRTGAPIARASRHDRRPSAGARRPVIVRSSCAERGWPGQFAGGTLRFGARRARRGRLIAGDRAGHRLFRRRRQPARSDFRAAHARARRDGRRRFLAPAERRWPLLYRQLRRPLRPHRRGDRAAPATISRLFSASSRGPMPARRRWPR